ncbi:hypothetical protein ACCT04_09855 [Rhizobium ruizarguesonis]
MANALLWIVRFFSGIMALIVAVFIFLWAMHVFLPSYVVKERSPILAASIDNVFGPEQRLYPRGQPLDTIQKWHDHCFEAVKVAASPETKIIYEDISNLVLRMEADQTSANTVIENIQGNQTLFSVITIALSLATTLISAALVNNLAGSDRAATILKYTSIAVPAVLTAVASLNAIFVNTEASARKNQITSAIIDLATSAGNDLITSGCIKEENQDTIAQKLGDWNKRYSAILVSSISGNAAVSSKATDASASQSALTLPPLK